MKQFRKLIKLFDVGTLWPRLDLFQLFGALMILSGATKKVFVLKILLQQIMNKS